MVLYNLTDAITLSADPSIDRVELRFMFCNTFLNGSRKEKGVRSFGFCTYLI